MTLLLIILCGSAAAIPDIAPAIAVGGFVIGLLFAIEIPESYVHAAKPRADRIQGPGTHEHPVRRLAVATTRHAA